MFLLYGPLAVLLYLRVFSGKSIQLLFSKKRLAEMEVAAKQARIPSTCAWTIISGLGFLSLAPHHEPRFLLPLLVPLAIISAPSLKSTSVLVVWVLFNVILLIVYYIERLLYPLKQFIKAMTEQGCCCSCPLSIG
jgi:phosphatidylinositol glycan class Z